MVPNLWRFLKGKATHAPADKFSSRKTRQNADATGGEPIFKDGKGIERITSGTYGYTVGKSLTLGFVKNAIAGDSVEVMILGIPHQATIPEEPPFDPKGTLLRA